MRVELEKKDSHFAQQSSHWIHRSTPEEGCNGCNRDLKFKKKPPLNFIVSCPKFSAKKYRIDGEPQSWLSQISVQILARSLQIEVHPLSLKRDRWLLPTLTWNLLIWRKSLGLHFFSPIENKILEDKVLRTIDGLSTSSLLLSVKAMHSWLFYRVWNENLLKRGRRRNFKPRMALNLARCLRIYLFYTNFFFLSL